MGKKIFSGETALKYYKYIFKTLLKTFHVFNSFISFFKIYFEFLKFTIWIFYNLKSQ